MSIRIKLFKLVTRKVTSFGVTLFCTRLCNSRIRNFQVKIRSVSITNENGMYELHHESPNDLTLKILGKIEISRKPQNYIHSSSQIKFLPIIVKSY